MLRHELLQMLHLLGCTQGRDLNAGEEIVGWLLRLQGMLLAHKRRLNP